MIQPSGPAGRAIKLFLFDIDGTLLTVNGLDTTAVARGIEKALGRPVSFGGISFSGKTDPQIFREIVTAEIRRGGQVGEDHEAAISATIRAYREAALEFLKTADVLDLPGARDLVGQLHVSHDMQLGLLTGNLRETAFLKLARVDLDSYFPFGAFGCDAEDRNALPRIALDRAVSHTGHLFAVEDVTIVGDTPRDIACGKHIGARTVAVATGKYTADDLALYEPDVLLESLEAFSFVLLT